MNSRLFTTLSLGLLMATCLPLAPAQETEARLPVRVLGGRMVVRCRVSSPRKTIPVNLFLAYDRLCGLELHNKVVAPLGVEHEDGTFDPITVELPGMDIEVDAREHGDEEDMEWFTRLYAPQMDEVACVGTIGAKILSQYVVTFDLQHGLVLLNQADAARTQLPEGPEAFYLPGSIAGDMVWFSVKLADGRRRMMAIGGALHDSVIDEMFCEELDAWDGNVGSIKLGDLDLSEFIAWRPEEFELVHPGGALGTLGLGFLRDFRVEIDAPNGWVGFTRLQESPFPAQDRAFFAARAEEEVPPLLEWLKEHGETRLGRECAELLLQMQIDEGSGPEEMRPAIEWVHKTRLADMRASEAINTVATLLQGQCRDAAVIAAELGVDEGRKDRYPESVHRLHATLGEIHLGANRDRKAWEHLMSAAFGLSDAIGAPDRARVNLLLGEYYERAERYKRAMSRYVQAVITPEAGPRAVVAMERLQEKMGGEPFSVALIEKLISGKVRGMTAPTRYEANEAEGTNRVVLLEHVTNPHFGVKRGEQWRALAEGGSMVFEALSTHFPRERVAVISYHTDVLQPVATMNELSMRNAELLSRKRPAFALNGRAVAAGALDYFKADGAYDQLRGAVRGLLARPSEYEIDGEIALKDGLLTGEFFVTGPATFDHTLELMLVERAVVYPGLGRAVIHRMLARGHLTEDVGGAPLEFSEDVAVEIALEDIVKRNREFLETYEQNGGSSATRLSLEMDQNELSVVAVLRAGKTRRVLQARHFEIERGGQ